MASILPFTGYLFKILRNPDKRSRDSLYCLQNIAPWKEFKDLPVIFIKKKSHPYGEDKDLDAHLGKIVTMDGLMTPDGLDYTSIKE